MLLFNTSEGGSDGTAVTAANSGLSSGNSWDNVTIGGSASVVYSATQSAHGNLSQLCTTGATSTTAFLRWSGNSLQASAILFARAYFYFTATSPDIGRIIQFTSSGTLSGGVGIASGKFVTCDSTGSTVQTSTTSVPTGQWIRLETKIIQGSTSGQVELKIFTSPDSATPTETLTSPSNLNTLGTNLNNVYFGIVTNTANASVYVDDMELQDIGYPGPYAPINQLRQNSAEGLPSGWTLGTANSGGSSGDAFELVVFTNAGTATGSNVTAAHNTTSYYITAPSATDGVYLAMGAGYDGASAAARGYVYLNSFPANGTDFMQLRTPNGPAVKVQLWPSGVVKCLDFSAVTHTFVAALSLTTWYRFEVLASNGTTTANGAYTVAFYTGDGTTAIESFSSTTSNTDTTPFNQMRIGKLSTSQGTFDGYIDDIAFIKNWSSFIGPASASVTAAWL